MPPSSVPLYDALAPEYDRLFEAPHRRAYDTLAWEMTRALLPGQPGQVIDAGCGTGRWARRIVDLGHSVIGIDQSPAMAAAARAGLANRRFRMIQMPMQEVVLPDAGADMVLAIGSLQYTPEPRAVLERFVRWVRPGGWVVVLVDSLVALVVELLSEGRSDEALVRLETQRGVWTAANQTAEHHLLDRVRLDDMLRGAGLTDVAVSGLLVGASALGRARLTEELTRQPPAQMSVERRLTADARLADLGKHLFGVGRREA